MCYRLRRLPSTYTYHSLFAPDGSTGQLMTEDDARDLGGGQWISDMTINSVLNLERMFHPTQHTVLLDAGFLNHLENLLVTSDDPSNTEPPPDNPEYKIPATAADDAEMLVITAPPVRGKHNSAVIMPFCFGEREGDKQWGDLQAGHWGVVALYRRSNQWVIFSSLNGYQENLILGRRLQRLVNFCAQRWSRGRGSRGVEPVFVLSNCTQQIGNLDCGIYTIENAAALVKEGSIAATITDLTHINFDPQQKRRDYFQALFKTPYYSSDWQTLRPVQVEPVYGNKGSNPVGSSTKIPSNPPHSQKKNIQTSRHQICSLS